MKQYQAGVWEQGREFVGWSKHSTEELARSAAVKYARQQAMTSGGPLSWCGGVMAPDGTVTWYQRDGSVAESPSV